MKGNSDSLVTTKTEFMRYLDENPEAIAALKSRYTEYKKNFARGSKFGGWMRQKYLTHLTHFYKQWWLRHPEFFGAVYEQQDSLSLLARK